MEALEEAEELRCLLLWSFLSPSRMWLSFRRVGCCSSGGAQMLLGAEEPRLSLLSQVRDDCRTTEPQGDG